MGSQITGLPCRMWIVVIRRIYSQSLGLGSTTHTTTEVVHGTTTALDTLS